ncbi:hypothetical protein RRG08_043458 [Elysia crispata]|uniref:Uncharacterized protein n=1 Tax=Elysia crispata TaxID=231223 RepID=A0AAE0XPH9_9GAST|nr:hypothetical protein RRG08_043458 [Elysia crispata]
MQQLQQATAIPVPLSTYLRHYNATTATATASGNIARATRAVQQSKLSDNLQCNYNKLTSQTHSRNYNYNNASNT